MTLIDLSALAAPDIIETVNYETILAGRKARMVELFAAAGVMSDWDSDLESDPIVIMLQESAYNEVLLRQRVNDGAHATMLAYATGTDLEQIAARVGVKRLTVTPADDSTTPPTEAVMESDDRLRLRTQLAPEGFSVAGPAGAYRFFALSASAQVKSCEPTRPEPGTVRVSILSTDGDGTASADLLATVLAALDDEDIRPLNDTVEVVSAEIIPYEIAAELVIEDGPDTSTVLAAAIAAAQAYADDQHALGATIARSGLDKALHQAGVSRVILSSPAADIIPAKTQAAYCSGLSVTPADDTTDGTDSDG